MTNDTDNKGLNALHNVVVCVQYSLSFTVTLLAGHTLLATKICIIFPDCSSQNHKQAVAVSRGGGGSASVHAVIPPSVGLETPQARPLKLPLGCGPGNLQGMVGYTPRDLLQGMLGYYPSCEQND